MLTPEKIEELRGLLAADTSTDWQTVRTDPAEGADVWWLCAKNSAGQEIELGSLQGGFPHPTREARARLICAMRNALPALLDLASKALATLSLAGEDARPEDRAEQFIQAAVDSAPEPLRRLGEWLANKLDDDDWKTAERLLNGASVEARSLTLRVEAEKRAKEEATEDTRSLCRFILSEWGPDGALKATTYSLEQREARSAKGGDANDSGPSRPIDATSPGVTAGASTLEAAETHSAALAGALEEAKGVWKPISALWSKPAECGKGCPPRQVCDFCQRELFLGWNGDYVELWNTTNYYLCRERSEPHWKHMAEEAARLTHFMAFDMPDRARSLLAPKEDTDA